LLITKLIAIGYIVNKKNAIGNNLLHLPNKGSADAGKQQLGEIAIYNVFEWSRKT
jgi:hypothetical protein